MNWNLILNVGISIPESMKILLQNQIPEKDSLVIKVSVGCIQIWDNLPIDLNSYFNRNSNKFNEEKKNVSFTETKNRNSFEWTLKGYQKLNSKRKW